MAWLGEHKHQILRNLLEQVIASSYPTILFTAISRVGQIIKLLDGC